MIDDVSSKPNRPAPRWWMHAAWGIPVLCGLALSLLLQRSTYGLPIDDAYIYMKYIDNLARGDGLSFNPGETSFGVTSFLFTILGASLKILLPGVGSAAICQGMGIAAFAMVLWGVQRLLYELTGDFSISWIGGAFLALSRPLYFTAPSGLETMLFLAVAVGVMGLGLRQKGVNRVWFGMACAVLFLSRPEGLYFIATYLAGLILYPIIFENASRRQMWKETVWSVLYFLAAFVILASPYLTYVKWHSGKWMPMTFYGKLINRNNFLLEPLSQKIRVGYFVILDGYKQIVAQDTLPFFLATLIVLTFFSYLIFAYQCGRRRPSAQWFAMRAAMVSFCFFPFLYGAAFRTSPVFGGFFIRYIQILLLLIYVEAALAAHYFFGGISRLFPKESLRTSAARFLPWLLFPIVLYSFRVVVDRWNEDIVFYRSHVSVNEKVRRWAGEWIDRNTPADSRVFTSNSGLGAVGLYCNRFVRDEAGLINPDIYPFLRGFSQGFHHWFQMLEYMKNQRIDYLTILPPYGTDTRHTQTVAEFQESSLRGTQLERLSRIRVMRFIAPEIYDLWAEYEKEATFVDRAPQPVIVGRVEATQWEGRPVLTVRTGVHLAEIRQRMLFPDNAHFTAGIAADSDSLLGPEDRIVIEIKVNHTGKPQTVLTHTYSLGTIERRKPIDRLDVDLSAYNNRYAYFLFGVRAEGPNAERIRAGWIEPFLANRQSVPLTP